MRTTDNVATVVASGRGATIEVPRVGPGLFELSVRVPVLPPRLRGSYPLVFDARTAGGAAAQSSVGVSAP